MSAYAAPKNSERPRASLDVSSTAFAANNPIPAEFTCEGGNQSPPLAWSGMPAGTKSIAILVEDPDAPKGPYLHWLVVGIDPSITSLDKAASLPSGAMAAKNDKGNAGYVGPCPPAGKHHYYFRVYALDTKLSKPNSKIAFVTAIANHVLAQGELVGTYEKAAH